MARRIDDILAAIRSLPSDERNRLAQLLRRELDQEPPSKAGAINPSAIIGLFADEPELIDEVCESAMQSRQEPRPGRGRACPEVPRGARQR